jgi:lipoprotein NlpD
MVAVLASACGSRVYHRVRPGETLYRISKAYGVSVERLATVNHLKDPSRIEVGQRLLIPGAGHEVPVDIVTPKETRRHHDLPNGFEAKPGRSDDPPPAYVRGLFAWPVASGSVTSGFGPRGRGFHDGIDIAAAVGTAVIAAADGEVIYADSLPGYGNVVILRHRDGYATVYAHNRKNLVREGTKVRRGQEIATLGDSGRTTGANLHFEVRQDNVARNPLYFLPPIVVTGAEPR